VIEPFTLLDLHRMCADIEDRMDGFPVWRVDIRVAPTKEAPGPFAQLSFNRDGFGLPCVALAGAVRVSLPAGTPCTARDHGSFSTVTYRLGNGWKLEHNIHKPDPTKPVVELEA